MPTPEALAAPPDDRLYRAAVDSHPDAFVAVDADERILVWSSRAEELFGWSAGQAVGRTLAETLLPEVPAPRLAAGLRQRITVRRRNGDSFPAEVHVSVAEIEGRTCRLAFFHDIADTLLAEQQLVQAQKLESIGHLTGGLAHDFNNILGIIIGSLDLVALNTRAAVERELLAAALSAAHRGADITRSLLAVARRRALRPQPTEVNELIEELVPLLRQSAGKSIEVDFSANAIASVCNIDAGGLNNALVNLVINARDAMPAGGRILVYTYTTEILPNALLVPPELAPGPYLVVGVDDTGSGMAPEVALRAFDPFFTTKGRTRGTGLGLAMVYGFARQSGGTARIESAPGKGASVQLLLPVLQQVAAVSAVTLPAAAPAAMPARYGRILLVDDEQTLLQIAGEWLTGLGHSVQTAASADEALAILAEHRFDLLLTDIAMPGSMDGLSLVERCRRLYPEMPALIATGFADGHAASLRTGAPVLDKPYTRSTLTQAVQAALQGRAGVVEPAKKRVSRKPQKRPPAAAAAVRRRGAKSGSGGAGGNDAG